MAVMVSGLGGPAGYGENVFSSTSKYTGDNDDGAVQVDITSVFGAGGIDFFGTSYTSLFINTNGNISFGTPNTYYESLDLTAEIDPIIAAFWADVDITSGGEIYWDLDPVAGTVTITWDGVAPYLGSGNNSFQLVLTSTGSGDFTVDYIYEDIQWTDGGGAAAQAGLTDGGSNDFLLDGSGDATILADYETHDFGTDDPSGITDFTFVDGEPVLSDGVVSGTTGNDVIGAAYTDTDGDVVDGGDGTGAAGNEDLIHGHAGDDTIAAGDEADTVFGDAGADSIDGGSGDDTIYGDFGGTGPTSASESLDWSAQGADATDLSAGFTQTTGEMEVTVTFTSDGDNLPEYLVETTDTVYVGSGEPFDPNSSVLLLGDGDGPTSTTTIDFAATTGSDFTDEVQNVSFRINDIDWGAANHTDIVTINAFDADGNPVKVSITVGAGDIVSGNTITAEEVAENFDELGGSALIEIAGPVSSIEISYSNGQTVTQGIWVTDVHFETIVDPALEGDDSIDGGAGDDLIYGEGGADTIAGGAGNDAINVGDADGDVDTVALADGDGDDAITGFEGPIDNGDGTFSGQDLLDVTGLTDASGNPVDTDDVVVTDDGGGNAVLTFPNGESLTFKGISPADLTDPLALVAIGIPLAPETVHDAILLTGLPGDTDMLVTGSEMLQVDEPLDFNVATPDELNIGDTVTIGGTLYSISALHDYEADMVSDNGAASETVHGHIVELDDGSGGTMTFMLVDDSYGPKPDIINAQMIFVDPAPGAVKTSGYDDDQTVTLSNLDFIVEGTGGDDLIDTAYAGDPEGDRVDNSDHSDASNNDSIDAGAGNDTVYAGLGDDTVSGSFGDDLLYGEAGDDTMHGGVGNDTLDGGIGNDTLFSGHGDDSISGGAGDDNIRSDAGLDTVSGGTGNDYIDTSTDDDLIILEDKFGNDTISGGVGGEITGDTLDTSAVTSDLTFNLASPDPTVFTVTDGTSTAQVYNVENIVLGGGRDTIILGDGFGADDVQAFDLTDSGDGTTNDQLNVSGLTSDGGTTPVTTTDVTVTDDGSGNAVLTFPGGESITLIGVAPASVDSIDELVAIGIPDGRDYIVEGTSGNDVIDGTYVGDPEGDMVDNNDHSDGSNDDSIVAGAGDDSVTAGAGDDTVFGEDGDDTLVGGFGADVMYGGIGDDHLVLGAGDSVIGGDGDDTFVLDSTDALDGSGSNIKIIGGEGDETDGDTLDFSGLIDWGAITYTNTDDAAGGLSGTATLSDGTVVDFSEIENIIVCFTQDTPILTPHGERMIQDLRCGDLVLTRDHGPQPVRWLGHRTVLGRGRQAPIRFAPGAMGNTRAIQVSPQHRMLHIGAECALYFGSNEVMIPAKHLVNGSTITQADVEHVTYYHMLFDTHEVVYASGAPSESFHPGQEGLQALSTAAREELFTLLPKLRSDQGAYGDTARTVLRGYEAKLLNIAPPPLAPVSQAA